MSAIRKKQMQLKRTVVTEFKVTVADIQLRKKAMQGSIAKPVDMDTDFISGDAICSDTSAFTLTGIKTAVVLHSFRSLEISLTIGGITTPYTTCHGLFIFYGAIDRIDVQAVTGAGTERFTYVRS